ncbi:hypothetical protein VaNZ11_007949 [Volvox africanus]|uniref:Pherophorin domain-containing protein n=1 Tax=Volvox africanus TaxID=51714 RepID=A0ABQ5S424_9CHLO|nr:hypothetical protein VaNZ11_007949 [Volvox africanus]
MAPPPPLITAAALEVPAPLPAALIPPPVDPPVVVAAAVATAVAAAARDPVAPPSAATWATSSCMSKSGRPSRRPTGGDEKPRGEQANGLRHARTPAAGRRADCNTLITANDHCYISTHRPTMYLRPSKRTSSTTSPLNPSWSVYRAETSHGSTTNPHWIDCMWNDPAMGHGAQVTLTMNVTSAPSPLDISPSMSVANVDFVAASSQPGGHRSWCGGDRCR